jgi:Flp pilus assembly protein TadD
MTSSRLLPKPLIGALLATVWVGGCGARLVPPVVSAPKAYAAATGGTTGGLSAVESLDSQLSAALLVLKVDRSPDQLVRVGTRYYQLNIRDRAMDYYTEALTADGRHPAALDGRARVLRDWGFIQEALSDAHSATLAAPQSAAAFNTLGTILQASGDYESARAAYTKAAGLDLAAPYAVSNLCYLSFLTGSGEAAANDCSAALARNNSFVPAKNNLALTYAALGQTDAARAHFAGSTTDASGRYNMGIVFLAERRYEEAAAEFHAATRIAPAFAAAHRRARQAVQLAEVERKSPDASH